MLLVAILIVLIGVPMLLMLVIIAVVIRLVSILLELSGMSIWQILLESLIDDLYNLFEVTILTRDAGIGQRVDVDRAASCYQKSFEDDRNLVFDIDCMWDSE